jgi:hypothetical protein
MEASSAHTAAAVEHAEGKVLRVGFLSTANIATKNALAVKASKHAKLVAVASRDLKKAEEWAQKHDVPKAYGSYEELLAASDVDAVYIPLPTMLRKEWAIKAAAKGKHILCDKPVAGSLADVQEMIAACRTANVQWMDGVMFMHSDRLPLLSKLLHAHSARRTKVLPQRPLRLCTFLITALPCLTAASTQRSASGSRSAGTTVMSVTMTLSLHATTTLSSSRSSRIPESSIHTALLSK